MLTYDSSKGSSVRLFLCKTPDGEANTKGRITSPSESNIANPKELREAYRSNEAVSHCILQGVKSYTAVISAFNQGDALGGTLTLETDVPMVFRQLAEEG